LPKKIVVFADPRSDASLPRRMLTIPEAAIYIGSTNSFVARSARSGEIPSRFVGNRRAFDVQDLDDWINAQPFAAPVESKKKKRRQLTLVES
jgi:excisionase family DNA binding protein